MTASGHAKDGSDQLRWKKGTGRRYENSDTHEQSGKPVAAASPRKVSRSRVEQMAGEELTGLENHQYAARTRYWTFSSIIAF